MKKKAIIISMCVVTLLIIIFIFLFVKDDSSNILECSIEDVKDGKKAEITYTYTMLNDNILQITSVTKLFFENKEDADKYEKIVTAAFFKDEITRENNTLFIKSEKQDDENELTLEEIRIKQESNGFICN